MFELKIGAVILGSVSLEYSPTDGARNLTTIELTNNILDCGKYNSHQQSSTSCVKINQIKNSSYSVNILICLSHLVWEKSCQ